MSYKLFISYIFAIAISFVALTVADAQDLETADSNPPGENVVLQWNRVLQETIRTPGQHPGTIFPVRSLRLCTRQSSMRSIRSTALTPLT